MAEAPNNTHNKRSLIETSHVCHRLHAAGRSQQVGKYKHTHTHTHTHTHIHTHTANVLEDDVDKCEKVNIVLMTEDLDKNEIFVDEASKSAVIDTASTKTVAGEKWYQNFKTNLPSNYIAQIE